MKCAVLYARHQLAGHSAEHPCPPNLGECGHAYHLPCGHYVCPSSVHDLTLHALCQVDATLTAQGTYVAFARRALCDVTKPSLAILPAGRTTMRVVASASMPSVTLLTLYSVSSTCAASAGQRAAPRRALPQSPP